MSAESAVDVGWGGGMTPQTHLTAIGGVMCRDAPPPYPPGTVSQTAYEPDLASHIQNCCCAWLWEERY